MRRCKCSNKSDAVCATDPATGITSTYGNTCKAGCGRFPVVYQGTDNCLSSMYKKSTYYKYSFECIINVNINKCYIARHYFVRIVSLVLYWQTYRITEVC